ncbi:putative membrane protein [Rhizobium leguminosarum bv. trifolii WSM2012]|nr:putative membrane protein [Rhizobium leguminosarum bv. trifolii WSM2012]
MGWNRWYSLKSYIRSSLWIVPFVALLLYVAAIRFVYVFDGWSLWNDVWPWGVAGTQRMLETIITMTLTFVVFTFGSLLVAIQVAGGQLTPRIIATTLLSDNAIRFTVGLFIFTLLFATGALARLDQTVLHGVSGLAGLLGFLSIAAFLYLIDYAARLLRPVSIILRVGEKGHAVIEEVYPDVAGDEGPGDGDFCMTAAPDRVVYHQANPAVVVAVNLNALIALAERTNSLIELVPRVGDFVGTDEALFRLYGRNLPADRTLKNLVALGPERTLEQDSTFAFRIIADIGIKALSKAINDPTTAVLAIDQLQRLLCFVGRRRLFGDEMRGKSGKLRLIRKTPNWEDFVQLSFSEIRLYGAENFQIARRLRAVIEYALQVLPDDRRPALLIELDLLDRMMEKIYLLPEDLMLARTPDSQGLGGSARLPGQASQR